MADFRNATERGERIDRGATPNAPEVRGTVDAQRVPHVAAHVAAPPTEPDAVAIPEVLLGPQSFLCGPAGTGKTTLARAMAAQLPGTVIAATTGIASVNLGEGTTINSLLRYFDTASLRDAHVSGHLQAVLGKLWRSGIRRILTDEVSMMDGEQLTIITQALDELGGKGYVLDAQLKDEMDELGVEAGDPGIALNLIGDFAQLPPVKAPFAFESPMWERYAAATHTLTKIWRQADLQFIQALQAARSGQPGPVIDYFGPRLSRTMDDAFAGPTILATNDAVDRLNALRMVKLTTPPVAFRKRVWGVERADWKGIPETLTLKDGALVMILANRRERRADGTSGKLIYANGDLGTVTACGDGRCVVTLQRTGRDVEVETIERTNTIPLEPGRMKQLKAEGHPERIDRERRQEIIGAVTYLPVRVAYGTTVHKSQGLTLDRVQVNISEGFFRSAGLLYVALSRARSADGLRLVGSIEQLRTRCTVNGKVAPWL